MDGLSIGAACTIIGAFIGILGAIRLSKKDTKEDTQSFTRVETKLDYIGKDISDIKMDFRTHATKIASIEERVTRVEESTKSAHHRIDGLIKEE